VARRINLKGVSGSGKSTLGRELAARLQLPYIELDALHHGPGWSEPGAAEFRARVREAMGRDGWVVDGNYEAKLGDLVLGSAETVVWLDLPLPLILRRLWRRTLERIRGDVELWNGNRESWRNAFWGRESLFAWTVRSWVRHRWTFPRRFASHPELHVVRLRTPADVRRWLEAQRPES
jgi:adenylate kinase family enzyme